MQGARTLRRTVIEGGYCVGCGACAAVPGSPASVRLDDYGRYSAVIDSDSDDVGFEPGLLSICPFASGAPSEDGIAVQLYSDKAEYDDRIGYHLATYVGFAAEGDFRARGGSGGMAKWVLHELMREGLVDAAIHVAAAGTGDPHTPLYEYRVAETTDAIRAGAKSVYYPVEMSGVLAHIREHAGRYAMVGLPCFIKAARLLALHDPVIAERLRYTVGLICGHLKSTRYAEMLAWQGGIEPGDLVSIDFRVKIPGRRANEKGVEIVGVRNGAEVRRIDVVQSFLGTDYNLGFFKYPACDYCDDVVAETADVAVGDAWLPEYLDDGRGTSVVIVRHAEILALLTRGTSSGRLRLSPVSKDRVIESQAAGFRHRREGLSYRLYLKDRAGLWYPPKRVSPRRNHLSRRRRRVYELRMEMARRSDEAFCRAVRSGGFGAFRTEMEPLLSQYAGLFRAPLWRRSLGRVTRLLRRVRARFGGGGQAAR
jgi:coenzyme F420 hydrogenase subunit beta